MPHAKNVLAFHIDRRQKAEQYQNIILAFDNDKAGEEATQTLNDYIKLNYPECDVFYSYPTGKDWNDDLVDLSKKPNEASFTRESQLQPMGMFR